jgi:hypothetical protein
MTYGTAFFVVFGCGVAALLVGTLLVWRDVQRRAPLLVVAAFAWLYASHLLVSVPSQRMFYRPISDGWILDAHALLTWFTMALMCFIAGYVVYRSLKQPRVQPRK